MRCQKPDRDVPELVCGYPIPCPWHTVIIDTTGEPATITIPATVSEAANPILLKKLKAIANVLTEEKP